MYTKVVFLVTEEDLCDRRSSSVYTKVFFRIHKGLLPCTQRSSSWVRASSAPHLVSARSGGYSVSTNHILSACIIGASVSNVSSVPFLFWVCSCESIILVCIYWWKSQWTVFCSEDGLNDSLRIILLPLDIYNPRIWGGPELQIHTSVTHNNTQWPGLKVTNNPKWSPTLTANKHLLTALYEQSFFLSTYIPPDFICST